MLRFFLDKLRKSPGPLKQARIIVGDLGEEILDIAEHYLKKLGGADKEDTSSAPMHQDSRPQETQGSTTTNAGPRKNATSSKSQRTLEVSRKFAAAIDSPANQKKQAFKVLAILWDAKNRNLGNLSAKQLSEHGEKLGLAIRHENVRKTIRMRLENYVDTLQDRAQGMSIYHYRITAEGALFFQNKYLI